jgi:hypothetical protein
MSNITTLITDNYQHLCWENFCLGYTCRR